MKRILLRVAYDGTAYCGWQSQSNGLSIEAVLNRELSQLLGEPITIIGASRTDSGVHALGNVAVFDTETRIPPEKISFALNQRLPADITIQESCEVDASFHPRRTSCRKTYVYKILNRTFDIPTLRLYSHFVYHPLDLQAMRQAASYLVGEHDFKSFASTGGQAKSSIRTIYSIDIVKEQDMITIRINGTGFLYNMVRIISGTLIQAGHHIWPPEHMLEILMARDRAAAGPTAPARGLTLMEIEYDDCSEPGRML